MNKDEMILEVLTDVEVGLEKLENILGEICSDRKRADWHVFAVEGDTKDIRGKISILETEMNRQFRILNEKVERLIAGGVPVGLS